MRKAFGKIRGFGYLFWHGRHMFYHLLLGCLWMWVVQEGTGIYSTHLLFVSLLGSVFPDFEHLLFFATYGKKDAYTAWVKSYVKHGDWRVLVRFLEKGHKFNTKLQFHNVFILALCCCMTGVFYQVRMPAGYVFFGSMSLHFIFDIFDDLGKFGRLNKNWFRWGKSSGTSNPAIWKNLDKTIKR